MGHGVAGFASGDFFAEPSPHVKLYNPSKPWHVGRVMFEQWWLAPFGLKREILRLALTLGSKVKGVPITL